MYLWRPSSALGQNWSGQNLLTWPPRTQTSQSASCSQPDQWACPPPDRGHLGGCGTWGSSEVLRLEVGGVLEDPPYCWISQSHNPPAKLHFCKIFEIVLAYCPFISAQSVQCQWQFMTHCENTFLIYPQI